MTHPETWRAQAACAPAPNDVATHSHMFFRHRYDTHDTSASYRVCAGCPVRADCLSYALEIEAGQHLDLRDGIYGGTSPKERWLIDKARRGVA